MSRPIRAQDTAPLIAAITAYARAHGLSERHLSAVLSVVCTTPCQIDQKGATSLLRDLYPAQRVLASIVHRVVMSLGVGENRPSSTIQELLVRWLIMVWEALEDGAQGALRRCYGLLFGLVNMMSIRSVRSSEQVAHDASYTNKGTEMKTDNLVNQTKFVPSTGTPNEESSC